MYGTYKQQNRPSSHGFLHKRVRFMEISLVKTKNTNTFCYVCVSLYVSVCVIDKTACFFLCTWPACQFN